MELSDAIALAFIIVLYVYLVRQITKRPGG